MKLQFKEKRNMATGAFHNKKTAKAKQGGLIACLAVLFCLLAHSPALAVKPMVAAGDTHTVGLRGDGTVVGRGG